MSKWSVPSVPLYNLSQTLSKVSSSLRIPQSSIILDLHTLSTALPSLPFMMSSSSAQPLLLDEAARTRAYLEQWSASIAFELLTERRRIHLHRNIQTESLGVEEPEFVDTMPTSEQIVAAAAFRGGRPTPTPLTQPTSSAVKGQLSLSRHVLKSALHTIALATILELPTLWEAFQNGTSMTEPIRRIVATGALSALASPLLVKLQQYFEQYLPKLIESVMSAKKSVVLTSLLVSMCFENSIRRTSYADAREDGMPGPTRYRGRCHHILGQGCYGSMGRNRIPNCTVSC